MPGKQEFVPNKVNFFVCYSILHLLQNKFRFIKLPLFIKYFLVIEQHQQQ